MTSVMAMRDNRPQGYTPTATVYSGPKVDRSRNRLFHIWLEQTDAEYFMMVDADMVFPVDTIDRLVAHDKDIVGGLYFAIGPYGHDVTPTPRVVVPNEEKGGFSIEVLWDYPPEDLVKVDAVGTGCMLIKRHVAEAILEIRGEDHPLPWFAHGAHNGISIGEDIAFCLTAGKCGFEVWLDTGLVAGHIKPGIVDEEDYIVSLSKGTHPHYNKRGSVSIYQEAVNASQ